MIKISDSPKKNLRFLREKSPILQRKICDSFQNNLQFVMFFRKLWHLHSESCGIFIPKVEAKVAPEKTGLTMR